MITCITIDSHFFYIILLEHVINKYTIVQFLIGHCDALLLRRCQLRCMEENASNSTDRAVDQSRMRMRYFHCSPVFVIHTADILGMMQCLLCVRRAPSARVRPREIMYVSYVMCRQLSSGILGIFMIDTNLWLPWHGDILHQCHRILENSHWENNH